MATLAVAVQASQPKAPKGEMIKVQVAIPRTLRIFKWSVCILFLKRKVLIISSDYQWNHARTCLGLSREQIAYLVVCRVLDIQPPNWLDEPKIMVLPDLGHEYVAFNVDGQPHDFSLYGMVLVWLIW